MAINLRGACATALLVSLLALSACGGGGDDGQEPIVRMGPPEAARSFEQTGRTLDFAIVDDAMFTLEDPATGERVYSRKGQFDVDADGNLVSAEGWRLVGFPDSNFEWPLSEASAARIDALPAIPQRLAPYATSTVSLSQNLDAGTKVVKNGFRSWAAKTVAVVDANGNSVELVIGFKKTDVDQWDLMVSVNWTSIPSSSVSFAPDGTISAGAAQTIDIPAVVVAGVEVSVPIKGVRLDLSGVTQHAGPNTLAEVYKSGVMAGNFVYAEVSKTGQIRAYYDNGSSRLVGQMMLARFNATDRLVSKGAHGWTCGQGCVKPGLGMPGTEGINRLWLGMIDAPR